MEDGFVNPTEGAENMNPEIIQAFVEADAEHQAAVFGADEKTDPEPADGLADHIMETPEDYPAETAAAAKARLFASLPDHIQVTPKNYPAAKARKGRKKLPIPTPDTDAVVLWKEDIETAERTYGDGLSYELERLENEIRFYQDRAGESLLEMGKRLIRIKAHEEHGMFIAVVEKLGMSPRSAQYAMLAAKRFSNTQTPALLGNEKMRILTVLDEEDIKTLESGGKVKGMNLDEIEKMTVRELKGNLREAEEKIKKEKEARQKDRAAFEQSMLQKDAKINEMDMRLAGQEPPTKEQIAQTALNKMLPEYSIAVAKVNGAIREAYALVVKAEKIEGVNVQQLSDLFNQFSPDMQTFNDLVQTWMDEVDNAGPIEDWKLSDLPGGEAQA